MVVSSSYVIVHNIAKRHNVGTLVRSAAAFGVAEVIIVGWREFNSFGSHGSTSHIRFRHFFTLIDAQFFLKSNDCDICGVEITEGSVSITDHPFKRSTAFLFGNEGTGLSTKEISICDYFVYIPQYGSGTASLNVTVAASIVLHHFGGFDERNREGSKFVVGERPPPPLPLNEQYSTLYTGDDPTIITRERKARREKAAAPEHEVFLENEESTSLLCSLFGNQF